MHNLVIEPLNVFPKHRSEYLGMVEGYIWTIFEQ